MLPLPYHHLGTALNRGRLVVQHITGSDLGAELRPTSEKPPYGETESLPLSGLVSPSSNISRCVYPLFVFNQP